MYHRSRSLRNIGRLLQYSNRRCSIITLATLRIALLAKSLVGQQGPSNDTVSQVERKEVLGASKEKTSSHSIKPTVA